MKAPFHLLCLASVAASILPTSHVSAADVDARPPDRLTLTGNGSRFREIDVEGAGGSLNWLHYLTPDALVGLGAEHQYIEESKWTFGSLRGSWSRGEPASRLTLYGELQYGDGDDDGRKFDYGVAVLGLSRAFTDKFSVQLESKQIDVDTSDGNLPKLGLTYIWTPQLVTTVSYAHSVSGNLGTELTTARIDYYGKYFNLLLGGASGTADAIVLNLPIGADKLPAQDLTEGFFGIGKTFSRGEVLLLGDYQQLGDTDKVTVTLSYTAYIGSRAR